MQRYEKFADKIITTQKKRRYSTLYYPTIPEKSTDIFIVTKNMDRLDLLAHKYYGDARWWVIIAKANKLYNGTVRVTPGIRLRIPYPLTIVDVNDIFNENQF
jgi:hypothetical protein